MTTLSPDRSMPFGSTDMQNFWYTTRDLSTRDALPSWIDSSVSAGSSRYDSICCLEFVGQLAAVLVEELDAVVVVQVVRGADHDAELAAECLRQVGDARRRQRPDQLHVDACRDEARFERGLEHVARQARVLADERRAAVRREHARRSAGESQRELDGHRMLADVAAHAVGAEVFPAHALLRRPVSRIARNRAAHIFTASTVAATSCARMIARRARRTAPPATTLPDQPLAGRPARHDTDQRLARDADQQRAAEIRERAQVSQQLRGCARSVLPKPMPGSTQIASRAMPAARQAATRSRRKVAHFGDDVVVAADRPAWSPARPACA